MVFTVFRLLTDFVCLYNYEFWLSLCKIVRSSVILLLPLFNATFNNISVISRCSVLMLKETGVPRENHWPVASHWQTLSHNVVLSTHRLCRIRIHNVSGDKHRLQFNYHTITTTTTPSEYWNGTCTADREMQINIGDRTTNIHCVYAIL